MKLRSAVPLYLIAMLISPLLYAQTTTHYVNAVDIQPDGKAVFNGRFHDFRDSPRKGLARMHGDGTLDDGFVPDSVPTWMPTMDHHESVVLVLPDGKILSGSRQTTPPLRRYHPDGTLDPGFSAPISGFFNGPVGIGDGNSMLAVRDDGEILAATSTGLWRLNPDGSLIGLTGTNAPIHTLALQADGKILIAGGFTAVDGRLRRHIARLHADGSLDADFDPGADNVVGALALAPGGDILVAGAFTEIAGAPRARIARLHPDGSAAGVVSTFLVNPNVHTLLVQPDGKMVVSAFSDSLFAGTAYRGVGRLNADGSVDTDFVLVLPNSPVSTLALAPDGRIWMGGHFTSVNGDQGHLHSPWLLRLEPDGSYITGDTAPEPSLLVTPAALEFGGGPVGEISAPLVVTLTNTADAPVDVTAIAEVEGPFLRGGGDCPAVPFSLAPAESCTAAYQFNPHEAGDYEQHLAVVAGGSAVAQLTLSGHGVLPDTEGDPLFEDRFEGGEP